MPNGFKSMILELREKIQKVMGFVFGSCYVHIIYKSMKLSSIIKEKLYKKKESILQTAVAADI